MKMGFMQQFILTEKPCPHIDLSTTLLAHALFTLKIKG